MNSGPERPRTQQPVHPDTIDFLGVPLTRCTTSGFIEWMMQAGSRPRSAPAFVSYLNAHCSNLAAKDAGYLDLLRRADLVYADGQAIVWASRMLGHPLPERVNAADFIDDFCRAAAERKVSIYLLGSEEGVAAQAAERFSSRVPGLLVTGTRSGYFHDDSDVVSQIASSGTDILLLGMGVPHQEKWAAANLSRLDVKVIWCVGAMFEYHAGARARAPIWVRRAGLEWAFRLILEPRRLWRRYVVGNAIFVARVFSRVCRRL